MKSPRRDPNDPDACKKDRGLRLAADLDHLLSHTRKHAAHSQDVVAVYGCQIAATNPREFTGSLDESRAFLFLAGLSARLKTNPLQRYHVVDTVASFAKESDTEDSLWMSLPKWQCELGMDSMHWAMVTMRTIERSTFRKVFNNPTAQQNEWNLNVKAHGTGYVEMMKTSCKVLVSDQPKIVARYQDFFGDDSKFVIRVFRCAPRPELKRGIQNVLAEKRPDNVFDIWIRHCDMVKGHALEGYYLHDLNAPVTLMELLTDIGCLAENNNGQPCMLTTAKDRAQRSQMSLSTKNAQSIQLEHETNNEASLVGFGATTPYKKSPMQAEAMKEPLVVAIPPSSCKNYSPESTKEQLVAATPQTASTACEKSPEYMKEQLVVATPPTTSTDCEKSPEYTKESPVGAVPQTTPFVDQSPYIDRTPELHYNQRTPRSLPYLIRYQTPIVSPGSCLSVESLLSELAEIVGGEKSFQPGAMFANENSENAVVQTLTYDNVYYECVCCHEMKATREFSKVQLKKSDKRCAECLPPRRLSALLGKSFKAPAWKMGGGRP
jgi:hypothetical protein